MEQPTKQFDQTPTRDFVCADCVEDSALAAVVNANLESNRCDYCQQEETTPIAATLDCVLDHMRDRISKYWCDPVDELAYDGREGGYQGEVLNAWDLFAELDYGPSDSNLFDDMVGHFASEDWCKVEYGALSAVERRKFGWDAFKHAVKHSRRYTFWTMDDPTNEEYHPDYLPVGAMLAEISQCIREGGLIIDLPMTTPIWRVRVHDSNKSLKDASDFSAPPERLATQHNRMSPAGIPMFYGAEDFDTAIMETVDPERGGEKLVSGAVFHPTRTLRLLDLSDLPDMPSFFSTASDSRRESLEFLHVLATDLAKPIARGDREHIEYVPTQAFTEYVRFELSQEGEMPLDGIRYSSSKNGQDCYVVFCGQEECVEPKPHSHKSQLLTFDAESIRTVPMPEIPSTELE